jgi:hypothetical protein
MNGGRNVGRGRVSASSDENSMHSAAHRVDDRSDISGRRQRDDPGPTSGSKRGDHMPGVRAECEADEGEIAGTLLEEVFHGVRVRDVAHLCDADLAQRLAQ